MRSLSYLHIVSLVCALVVSALDSAGNAGQRSTVRRHEDTSLALQTENITSFAAISPHGAILAKGMPPRTGFKIGHDIAAPKQVVNPIVAQTIPEMFWSPARRSRIVRIIRFHMRPHQIWKTSFIVKHYVHPATKTRFNFSAALAREPHIVDNSLREQLADGDQLPLTGDALPGPTTKSTSLHEWSLAFLVSLGILGYLSVHVEGKLKVDTILQHAEDDLAAPRGRPCWASCCAISVVLLALLTFFLTLLVLSTTPAPSPAQKAGGAADADALPVGHPGERAYEAGQGVAMSVALMGFLIFRRRYAHSVHISKGLLALFAIRGATISVLVATILEFGGIFALSYITGMSSHALADTGNDVNTPGYTAAIALTMLCVGISEELAKCGAVLVGLWLSAGALRLAAPSWFGNFSRVLVENPHALMLAGLSVGCGFMTLENVGYLMSSGLTLVEKDDSVVVERIVRCVVLAVRVGLNLHPWLVGITAARVGQIAFAGGRETPSLSFLELSWALYPAVLAHAAFDFGLTALPFFVSLFLPAGVWFCARYVFDREWEKFEARSLEARSLDGDPSEEVVSPTAPEPSSGD